MDTETNRSASGPKSLWFWLTVFGIYLVTSVGVTSGAAQLLDLYSKQAAGATLKTELIGAACIIVVLGAGFALVLHMTIHYRLRYHLHRDRGLVRDLYPDRGHLIGHYKDVLEDATKVFRAAGISLHTLMSDTGFCDELRRSLTTKKELHVSLVFMKPYSAFVELKEKMEGRSVGRISVDASTNFQLALNLKQSLGVDANRLHLYQVDAIPSGFILQRDREIYYEPYFDNQVGRTCPTLVMQENDSNRAAFLKFVKYIDDLVARVGETLFPSAELGFEITPFGQSEERKILRKAIFFDRDGTLIYDPGYLSDPSKISLFPTACETIRSLNRDYRIIIVTNQSGIARGTFTESDLKEIHRRLIAIFEDHDACIDAILYCPHHPEKGIGPYKKECNCRKPKPGLLEAAAKHFGLNCNESFMVGDSERDIEAGNAIGTTSILIRHSKIDSSIASSAKFTISDVSEVAAIIRA